MALMMQTDSTAALGRTQFWTGENGVWLPPASSTTAPEIDGLFNFIMISSLLLTLFVSAAVVYFVWRYRRQSHADRPVDVHESKWMEISWIVLPTILVLVVFFWGFRAYVGTAIPPNNAYEINVKGQKWFWTFEYDNGVVTQDELWVPVGQPVRLTMTSQDVLHSFFVPEFRIKHDVLPNRFVTVWFEAPEEGVYQVVCTEYCGTSHWDMGAKIHVVSREAFAQFLRDGGPPGTAAGPPVQVGEGVYTARGCNACHSLDGSAGVGPSWLGIWGEPRPGSESGVVDDAYIAESILAPQAYFTPGYENAMMPSYDGIMNENEVAGVAAYIRQINGAARPSDLVEGAAAPDSVVASVETPAGDAMGDPSTAVADPVMREEAEAVRDQ